MTTTPAELPQRVGKFGLIGGLVMLALLVVLTGFGLMPGSGSHKSDDGRYDPLVAPEKLGGYPRWHGMVEGEIADARHFGWEHRARAIEATYLPPGNDPILVTAYRAFDPARTTDGVPYGKDGRALCSTSGAFLDCYRTGEQLTVDVLASKRMDKSDVAGLVDEFWRAQVHVATS